MVWFIKDNPFRFEKLRLQRPIEIVVAYSGIPSDTAKAVAGVKERMRRFRERDERIFREAQELAENARTAIKTGDLRTLGELMNQNHRLLQQIGVSCAELDRMVELARGAGAMGAKLTGGGLGGCIVALTPGRETQEHVAEKLEQEGYLTVCTVVGGKT